MSSIGVNGAETYLEPFTADDVAAPTSLYALSKFEAENGLRLLSKEAGMELVVIRPPLIYGPGAKGNLETMIRWIERGIPLPLGAIHNKRSLVALDNLVDLVLLCFNISRTQSDFSSVGRRGSIDDRTLAARWAGAA